MNKRIWGLGMAFVLTVSALLTGCGGGKGDTGNDAGTKTMGRYLEEELAPPEEDLYGIKDIAVLSDGTLRMAAEDKEQKLRIWDYKDESWTENTKLGEVLPQVEDANQQFIDQVALAPSGKAAVSMAYMETGGGLLFVVDEDGSVQDLSKAVKPDDSYPPLLNLEFTETGKLMAQGFYDLVALYDGTTGETVEKLDIGNVVTGSVAGDKLIVIGDHQVQLYDAETGSPLDKDEVLNEQISKDKSQLEFTNSSSKPVVFTKGEEDGIFYCTREGIFSHRFGGNTVEKVVDGKLCSISSEAVGFKRLTAGSDNDFFLLAMDDMQDKIYHYTYSADTPTVPGTSIKIYSLMKDDTISQIIPMFQKLYPDIAVDYQVGMSGDDGMTVSDALKNLNTEVMAGKGPDLFLLDNLPVDSYVEKGLLLDISDVIGEVAKSERLLENIQKSYENDGKIYVMPGRIGLPVMVGSEEDLEGITDLKTMADAGERQQAENPDSCLFSPFQWPHSLVDRWSDTCSPAWTKEDGSVDEEALSEFYSQLKRMLDLVENPYADAISAEEMLENNDMIPHYYGGISNELLEQYAGICRLAYGTVYGLDAYGKICTEQKEKGFVVKPWNGQVENCFVPSLMLGISSKCEEEDAAKKFLSYFFSKEVQMLSSYAGFPVNLAALEDESFWDSQEETTSGTTMEYNGKTYDVMMTSSKIEKENIDWMIEHLSKAQTPVPYNYLITDEVRRQAIPYMNGEISLEEAVSAVSQKMNLYLTE